MINWRFLAIYQRFPVSKECAWSWRAMGSTLDNNRAVYKFWTILWRYRFFLEPEVVTGLGPAFDTCKNRTYYHTNQSKETHDDKTVL